LSEYHNGVTIQEVAVQYEARLLELQVGIAQLRVPHALAAGVLTVATGFFLVLSVYAIRGQLSFFWSSVPIPIAAASARRLKRDSEKRSRLWRLKRFYDRAAERVKGNWAQSVETGEEFNEPSHGYAEDLHVFGVGSLFQLLCTTRTSVGRRGLANYLLEAPALEEAISRQEAVRELRHRADIRERVATLGEFDFLESNHASFEEWLSSPRLSIGPPIRVMMAITSALTIISVVAGLLHVASWSHIAVWIFPLITFQAVVGLLFRDRVNRLLSWLRPVSLEVPVLRDGLALVEGEQFRSAKLLELRQQVHNSSKSLLRLERLLGAIGQRDKDWFYGPSRALLAGTQLCLAVDSWRREYGDSLRIWLLVWSEFEALSALAGYSFENPDHTFPELTSDGARFEGLDLGHPLLPHDSCVANDIDLNRESAFYVVSGSNMSGKSTLLRAIGLNAVLAFAGAPVRARTLRLSRLSMFASLSVVDSLLSGKSKFLAEIDRLRQAIESADPTRPVLFLVDEIFSGTNSRDRRIAAEVVVRTLVSRGSIGMLSTHDLALTEIAGADGMSGVNVHMGSRDERNPMDFDYRVKPGVATETNALAIARMAGVPL
jgi:hypothetical protein